MKFKSLIFIVLAASMTCTDIYAENNRPIDIALWENGPLEKNDDEGKAYDENVRIYRPSIKVFLPEGKNTGRAVIMCPGGGYALLAYDHEGYAYADYFKHQGIALIVLKYRMPHGNHKVPMSDVCEAMRVVKSHAAEWKINPDDIGIMGFSAGGHSASTFATHYPAELRPAFQILVYPVISMDETITHSGSRENLIGKNPSKALIDTIPMRNTSTQSHHGLLSPSPMTTGLSLSKTASVITKPCIDIKYRSHCIFIPQEVTAGDIMSRSDSKKPFMMNFPIGCVHFE